MHELAHIELNQLNQIDNDLLALKVDALEDEADRYVSFLKQEIASSKNFEGQKQ